MSARIIIECPKCTWEPLETSLWCCSCEHCWNTFDTGGVCPNVKKKWETTQCLRCHKWSPHIDWYKNLDDWLKKQLGLIKQMSEHEQLA